MITGIGSWMFHMTLLYEMQLLDELPMVWGSCYMVYVHYKVQLEPQKKARILGVVMLLYAIVVTAVYLISMLKMILDLSKKFPFKSIYLFSKTHFFFIRNFKLLSLDDLSFDDISLSHPNVEFNL